MSDEEQERRFQSRIDDPMRRWKLSHDGPRSRGRAGSTSRARRTRCSSTPTSPEAPWYVVEGDDKRRARLNCIAHLLSLIPYEDIKQPRIKLPPRAPAADYERPPRELYHYVPDHAATLEAE